MASDARADASCVESAARHWEIAHRGFGDAWYRLGWSEGSTTASALQAWVEDEAHMTLRGTYGLRSPGEVDWEVFRVDRSGAVYPADPSAEDELEAGERSG